jgi:Flp pilus assembly protein CpaB
MARTMLSDPVSRSASPSGNGSAPLPVSLASPKHRRPSWVVAGVALVAFAALLGAWVFATTSDTMRVVVAARDLAPGEVVTAADLRVVEFGRSGDVRAVQAEQQELILGQAARGPIPAGTVLNTDLFSDREKVISAGDVVVGAALAPGAVPTAGLAAGDLVNVLGVVKTTGAEDVGPVATVLTTGTVWAVAQPTASGASPAWWVSLLIPEDAQTAVAQAASDGVLRLSMMGAAG